MLKSLKGSSLLEKAANFIKPLEGFAAKAYWDYKQYSYGYGTKAPNATATIDEKTASSMLMSLLAEDERQIRKLLKVEVTEGQMIALLSFNYNLGLGNTKKITDRMNKGMNKTLVAAAINLYINAGGKPHAGLVKRRLKEAALFIA
jgi:lysozyme